MNKTSPAIPILLVDDENDILLSYQMALVNSGINNIILCSDNREVLKILQKQKIAVVVLDLMMPHNSGQELLVQIGEKYPMIPIVVITGKNEVDVAVTCMKSGAYDYMVKPVDSIRLSSGIKRAIEKRQLQNEINDLTHHVFSNDIKQPELFKEIITNSDSIKSIFKYIEAIANSPRPVLITGESGVGKDLIAQAIHRSTGNKGELVTVSVGGVDDVMFSDTLFGHKKGAFTGAIATRKGFIEQATAGTLFLDEIGELENSSQIKLLRLLQNNEYYMLGSDIVKKGDVKIIAATNIDLTSQKKEGKFRNDLYHRLSTHHIHLPPLRERIEDIPPLVNHFLKQASTILGKKPPTIPDELYVLLQSYSFPGNIRELESMIFNAASLHKNGILSCSLFKDLIKNQETSSDPIIREEDEKWSITYSGKMPTLKEMEDFLIAEAMKKSKENQSIAALHLGISQSTLSRRFKKK